VIAYLFREYFYVHAVMWNTRAPEECDDDDFGQDIDENEFTFLLLTYGKSTTDTLAERLRDAITNFWGKRAGDIDTVERNTHTNPEAPERQPKTAVKTEILTHNAREAVVLPILEK